MAAMSFKLTPAQQRWGYISVGVLFLMGVVWMASSSAPDTQTQQRQLRTTSLTGTNVVDLTIDDLTNAQSTTANEVATLQREIQRLEEFLNRRLGLLTEELGEQADLRNTALSTVEQQRQEEIAALRAQNEAMTTVVQDLASRIAEFEQGVAVFPRATAPTGLQEEAQAAAEGPRRVVRDPGRVGEPVRGFTVDDLFPNQATGGTVTARDPAATAGGANRQRARAGEAGQQMAAVRPVVPRRADPASDSASSSGPALTLATGSIIRATLLNGALAPTSGTTRDNPLPMLLRVDKEALMPNRFRADIRDCFLIISGYGELSSERVISRAERLSCITDSGDLIEGPLSGYAVAEDGQVGIPGRVVSKAGTVLAAAALTGFAEGVSQAFQVDIVPVLEIDDGTGSNSGNSRNRFRGAESLQSAAAQGASSALGRLADYYLELADNILPVVEVMPGRKIEVLLTAPVMIGGDMPAVGAPVPNAVPITREVRSFRG